jgi:hypothetical protein
LIEMAVKTPKVPPTIGGSRKPRRRRDFDALPEFLPKACEFSEDSTLTDPLSVMRLVKKHLTGGAPGTIGDLWDRTSAKLDCSKKDGRNRKPGDWGLLYMSGFVMSRQSEMFSFWDNQLWSQLWAEAGFAANVDGDHRYSYETMWRRFAELEALADVFEEGADELVQLAMSKEERIGRDVYVDATNTHSRGRLHHDCPDKDECDELKQKATQEIRPASPEEVRDARHAEAKLPPEEVEEGRKSDPKPSEPLEGDKFKHYVWLGGHRYGVHDPDVGVRAYTGKNKRTAKAWVGGLDVVATEGFTGATIRNVHVPANRLEHHVYPDLMEKLIATMGGQVPEAVAGDRGYSIESVFRWNTERGIASVFPYRRHGGKHAIERQSLRNLIYDEHGVARCPHCGGPASQIPGVTFLKSGAPRIRFTCADPNTVDCLTSSWSLNPGDYKHGFRVLLPLSRLSPRYHAMSQTSLHFEKTHRDQRKRYWKDGADETCKLKRFGLAAHRLRSAAARFLEWFRLCLRHGWIYDPTVKLNTREPRLRNGEDRRLALLRGRRWQGLDLPYGPKAFALRLAPDPKVPAPRPSPPKKT